MDERESTLQPSKPFTLAIKDGCARCEENRHLIREFMKSHPYKYGNKMTIMLHQDWWGGDVWHIDGVEFGNYERENLERKLEQVKEKGDFEAVHLIKEAMGALEWNS